MNKGIDYGRGQTNIDTSTGIRYGVISQHEVLQAWADSSEGVYPECPDHGADCPDDCDYNNDISDPIGFEYNDDGYEASCGDDGDIFITKSPYFTYAQFCSPCAPGAGYLMNPVEPDPDNKCYCFGHDWFEGGKAPYPVYSVKTGKLVEPDRG
jgi:hypothetical protein